MAASAPETNIKDDSLRFTVKINSQPLSDTTVVKSILIAHEINKISFAEIMLLGDATIGATSIPFADDDSLTPGNPVTVTAGYGDNAEVSIFSGLIVRYGMELKNAGYQVRLICKHAIVSTTFGRKEQEFKDKTDDAIITAILGTHSLSATVDSTSNQNELFMQKLGTDWDLILSRAEFNGFVVLLDGSSGITIGKPKLSTQPVLTIAAGESIIDFTAELNAEKQPPTVAASAWDLASLALQTSTASEPSVNNQGAVTPQTLSSKLNQTQASLNSLMPMSTGELQAWADSYLLRLRLKAFRGKVSFIGSSAVHTGDLITLAGVGAKFNGDAYVSSVAHTLEAGRWKTTAIFGLDDKLISEKPDFSYGAALGQVPAIQGLQFATVKQLAQDPQSLNRILVTLPSNASSQNGTWARVANFYATNSAGNGFLPEVGDEVVLGFVENDPRYPVVLGSLYSTKNVAPNPAADENNYIKSITTKSKITLTFDDEKKILTIKTPAGNSITMSDDAKSIEIKDQNSNSIKMDNSDGITLSSNKDVTIKATGNIKLTATQKLSLESTQDMTLSSTGGKMNISGLELAAKGTATAEFSATGQTTLKGGIVMIN